MRPAGGRRLREVELAVAGERAVDLRLATLARLFFAGTHVRREEAEAALAPVSLSDLRSAGLLETEAGDRVRCPVRLDPFEGILLACDRLPDGPEPLDYVLGLNPSAVLAAHHTVRRSARSALDLGGGSGLHALLAARHSEHVVATDINARALRFAAFNAALNGAPNITTRDGSWFEPVAGLRFDLIVSNPPYVISPDTRLLYRDSDLPGDAASRMLVAAAAEHLEEGGFGHVQCAWILRAGDEPCGPPLEWTAGSGCDALILHHDTQDPVAYASAWNQRLRETRLSEFEEAVERWAANLSRLDAEAVGSGTVVLHRRERPPNWQRVVRVNGAASTPAGDHIGRIFEANDHMRSIDDAVLLKERLRPVDGYRLEQDLTYRDGRYFQHPARVRARHGLDLAVNVDVDLLELLFRLDGARSVRGVAAALAEERGADASALEGEALKAVKDLYALGLLERSGPARPSAPPTHANG